MSRRNATEMREADREGRERRDAGTAGADAGYAFRAPTTIELRSKDGAKMPGLRGYTAVFNSWSEPLGFFEDFAERIAPSAFAKTIGESDVRALFNHEPSNIFGRSKGSAGGTLRMTEDSTGLEFEVAELPDSSLGRDLAAMVERGDVDGCSFGFRTIGDEWTSVRPDGAPTDGAYADVVEWRTLLEVRLFDVGPVTYPAYPETTTEVRSKLADLHTAREARRNGVDDELAKRMLVARRHRLAELEARGAVTLG